MKTITCCGEPLECPGFTNTCPVCGADYNWAGQRLAHRSQWGEETGETLAEILSIDGKSAEELLEDPPGTGMPAADGWDWSRVAREILARGPDRVVVDDEGCATSPQRARALGIYPDVVFIRDDGWSLGASLEFAGVAEFLWADHWVGVLNVHDGVPQAYAEWVQARRNQ